MSPEIASSIIPEIENLHPNIEVLDLTEILGNTDPAYLLSSEEVDKLLKDGQKFLKMGRFAESIEKLEAVCAGVETSHKDLVQAQMSLVKAYQGSEQVARSIALCHHLKTSDKEYVQIWATEFLIKLTPAVESESIPPIAAHRATSTDGVESDEDEDPDSDEAEMSATFRQPQGEPKSLNPDTTAKLELASQITLSLVIGGVVAMIVVIVASVMMKPQPTPTSPVGTVITNLH